MEGLQESGFCEYYFCFVAIDVTIMIMYLYSQQSATHKEKDFWKITAIHDNDNAHYTELVNDINIIVAFLLDLSCQQVQQVLKIRLHCDRCTAESCMQA